MARVTFREVLEFGNYRTGEYRRLTREAEFEGSSGEISHLIAATSHLQLPAVSSRNLGVGSPSQSSDVDVSDFHVFKYLNIRGR